MSICFNNRFTLLKFIILKLTIACGAQYIRLIRARCLIRAHGGTLPESALSNCAIAGPVDQTALYVISPKLNYVSHV
jgi:hypothetical protein